MDSKYSLSIVFKSQMYKNKTFMEKIKQCAKEYNSSGSVIHFAGDDPQLHCTVDNLSMISDIFDMFEGYDINLQISKN